MPAVDCAFRTSSFCRDRVSDPGRMPTKGVTPTLLARSLTTRSTTFVGNLSSSGAPISFCHALNNCWTFLPSRPLEEPPAKISSSEGESPLVLAYPLVVLPRGARTELPPAPAAVGPPVTLETRPPPAVRPPVATELPRS